MLTLSQPTAIHRRPRTRRLWWQVLLLAAAALLVFIGLRVPAQASGAPIVGLAGKCLTDADIGAADGSPIALWTCTGGAGQAWTVTGAGAIIGRGKCLDVRYGETAPGTPVQLWECNGTGAQRWSFADGAIVNEKSGLCLDVADASPADGANVQVWTCGPGQANQHWLVSSPPRPAPATLLPAPAQVSWRRDFFDDFDTELGPVWGKYGYGTQPVGNGALGRYDIANVFTANGRLHLRTRYADGGWTSAGVSSGEGFSAVRGRWEVRARFDRGKGLGYVFLLYPEDHTWPPEVDLAEGRVNGPSVTATLHWGEDNQQRQKWTDVADMSAWHTYGVVMTADTITYTLDGVPWGGFSSPNIPSKRMWLGLQTGAMACPSDYECVENNVPNADTPAESEVEVEWVAHYTAT